MTNAAPQRVVWEIPAAKPDAVDRLRSSAEQLRVVAYCRVSTQQEEQLNSYETQVRHYTEAINAEPNWRFAGIYADKGIYIVLLLKNLAYEEHNMDILRKNRVFTRFFAPFWHFGTVTKKSRNADIFRILVGRELMSSNF